MSEIKRCQADGASWPGAIDGDYVEFLILTLAMGLCEVVATAGDETRRWRVVQVRLRSLNLLRTTTQREVGMVFWLIQREDRFPEEK